MFFTCVLNDVVRFSGERVAHATRHRVIFTIPASKTP